METWWQAAALDLSAEPSVPGPTVATFHQGTPAAPSTSARHCGEGNLGLCLLPQGMRGRASLIIQLVGFLAPVAGRLK